VLQQLAQLCHLLLGQVKHLLKDFVDCAWAAFDGRLQKAQREFARSLVGWLHDWRR
jgi:hypothetical protein